MEGLGINLGILIVQILSFLIIVVFMYAFLYQPMLSALAKRKTTISQGLEDARIAGEARANAEKEAQEIIAKAEAEKQQKIREAIDQAEATVRDILSEAETDSEKIRESARTEAQEQREQILADVRGQIAGLAIAATEKLVGETLQDKGHQRELIDEFFSGIAGGKVIILGDESLAGASAEVTSALPLTGDEKSRVEKEVLAKIGPPAAVSFRVDPSILGGLVIRVGDKVLDGSVAGKLETLRQSLH